MIISFFYLVFFISFLFAQEEEKDTRPNILLITPTNIGIDQFKQYGGLHHKTPNIDSLAENGMTFFYYSGRYDYVASFRTFLSGTGGFKVGWTSNDWPLQNSARLPQRIRNVGYDTCFVGKWAFPNNALNIEDFLNNEGKGVQQNEFNYSYPWNEGFKHYHGVFNPMHNTIWEEDNNDVYWGIGNSDTYRTKFFRFSTKSKYFPQQNVDYIKSFIDFNQAKKRRIPFFLWWAPVYMWYHRDGWYYDTPDSKKQSFSNEIRKYGIPKRSANEGDSLIYYANLLYMDKLVGQVIDKLKEYKIMHNTIIWFATLSGTTEHVQGIYNGQIVKGINRYILFDENKPYDNEIYKTHLERNMHLPMFIHWPKYIKKKSFCNYIISAKDFFVTLGKLTKAKRINEWVSQTYYESYDFSSILMGHKNKGSRRYAIHMFFQDRDSYRKTEDPVYIWAQTKEYKLYDDGRFYSLVHDFDEKKQLRKLSPLEKAIKAKLKSIIDYYPRRRNWSADIDPQKGEWQGYQAFPLN